MLGYDDVNSFGNFFLRNGERVAVNYAKHEQLAVNVPYSKLLAFWTGGARGWGVRCAAPITKGHVVVEVRGRCLTEAEYEQLADPSYVVSFDDKLLALKRAAADDVMYLDLREQGNMMRLINDCQEAPNLQLMYWPELDVARGVLPRRAFLVAKHDVPAGVELTWNYGRHYERHWLAARNGTGSGWSTATHGGGTSRGGGGGGGGAEEDWEGEAAGEPEEAPAEEARARALAEARDQLVAAEELLPWTAVRQSWGARRYDWLRRVHAAAEPAELGATIEELETAVRGWALGDGWPAARDGWQARVEALQRGGATAAADELAAVLRPLLSALQPALAGERAGGSPAAPPKPKSKPKPKPPKPAPTSSGESVATVEIVTSVVDDDGDDDGDGAAADAVVVEAVETDSSSESDDEGATPRSTAAAPAAAGTAAPMVGGVPSEAFGVKLLTSTRNVTGYRGVKRKGGGYILAENVEAGTFATAVEAAVAYAKGRAERRAARPATATKVGSVVAAGTRWLSPSGEEHAVAAGEMVSFCRQRGLSEREMRRVRAGQAAHHKGWRCCADEGAPTSRPPPRRSAPPPPSPPPPPWPPAVAPPTSPR